MIATNRSLIASAMIETGLLSACGGTDMFLADVNRTFEAEARLL